MAFPASYDSQLWRKLATGLASHSDPPEDIPGHVRQKNQATVMLSDIGMS